MSITTYRTLGVKHSQVLPLLMLKPIRVDCGSQVQMHIIHDLSSPCINCAVLAQPFCQPQQQLPASNNFFCDLDLCSTNGQLSVRASLDVVIQSTSVRATIINLAKLVSICGAFANNSRSIEHNDKVEDQLPLATCMTKHT